MSQRQQVFEISSLNYEQALQTLAAKKATLGFDGFVDAIVKVVKQREHGKPTTYFESSRDFAQYMLDKDKRNFAVELDELTSKLGGNMPIMANALSRLGASVSCIGALGYPDIHPIFHSLKNCSLYSVGTPGYSTAMEFKENKIMMAVMSSTHPVTWKAIVDTLGLDKVISLFSDQHLISLLNWSELEGATDIWRGLLDDVLPYTTHAAGRPIGFFDFADCSRKEPVQITEALALIKAFAAHWNVALGLNLNEATIVHAALMGTKSPASIHDMGGKIYDSLGIDEVIIHHATDAVCWNKEGVHERQTVKIKSPTILTGAGDNFNAGFCVARLLGADTAAALSLGHTVSGYYLRHGESPTLEQLVAEVKQNALVDK